MMAIYPFLPTAVMKDVYFQELTGSKLPVMELGFKTHEELFISLADTVLQLVYRGAGKISVLLVQVNSQNS